MYSHRHHIISSSDAVTPLVEVINPPYHPSKRTRLLTDVLALWNTDNGKHSFGTLVEAGSNEFGLRADALRTAPDTILNRQWKTQVGKWLLSEYDWSLADDPLASLLVDDGLAPRDAYVAAQQYRRLDDEHTPIYDLATEPYPHPTDPTDYDQ